MALTALNARGPRRRARAASRVGPRDARAAPAARRQSRSRTPCSQPGELITEVELPPPPRGPLAAYRKVRERASFAFALVSLAALLDIGGTAGCGTAGSPSAAWRTPRGGRTPPSGCCAGCPPAGRRFARGGRRGTALRRARCPATSTRSPWPATSSCVGARGAARRASTGVEGHREQGHRRRQGTPIEYPVPRRGVRLPGPGARSPAADDRARSTPPRRARHAGGARGARGEATRTRSAAEDFRACPLRDAIEVTYRGQLVGVVVADTLEKARAAAGRRPRRLPRRAARRACCARTTRGLVPAGEGQPGASRPTPATVTSAAGAGAARRRGWSVTYTTPVQHNNPMEPHAAIAERGTPTGALTIYDSTQGPSADRDTIARHARPRLPSRCGSSRRTSAAGSGPRAPPAPHAILAALAARAAGPPGQGGAHQAADVHPHRPPDADHPAGRARRRPPTGG